MPYKINSIAVFCGSGQSADEAYSRDAYKLGEALAKRDIGLIYGGSNLGLMRAMADAVLDHGGRVIGMIQKVYATEAYARVTDMRVADTPHERKNMFYAEADGFISMPGGFGMLEEMFETIKWENDGILKKPCGILNTNGFFDSLLAFLNHAAKSGFLKQKNLDRLFVANEPDELLEKMLSYQSQ